VTEKTAIPRKKASLTMQERKQKYGFYASTFTAEEMRYLDIEPSSRPEFALLRTKILRLAKLTPLRSINEDQLDTLIKLVRVVAALDAMERTSVMRTKVEGGVDPALDALAADDLQDL
jgi:hypothetical protein